MVDGLLSSSSMALQYVKAQQQARPDLANLYADLADLYQRKLWHQLTLKLDQFLQIPAAQTGDTLIQLYNNFISDFVTKINLLKLAQFVVIASRQYPEKDAAITFLKGIITKLRETSKVQINEPILHVKMQIAAIHLENGNQEECRNLLEEGLTTLEGVTDVDPLVHASFYWISSQYHKATQEFNEFYKNALLYLSYTTLGSLSESFKLDLAFDLSLAALLGDNINNFRELLAHPISKSLMGTKVEWIYQMLQAFNTGNLARYQELCTVHNAAFSAQPALVQNEQKLLEKFKCCPSEDGTIPLSNDAEQIKLSTNEVECLMERLSVKEEQTKDIRELISKQFKGMPDKQMQEMTEHFKEMTDPEAEDLRLKIKGLLTDMDIPGVPYNSQIHPYIIRFSMLHKLDTALFHIQVARMRTLEAIQVLQEAANGPSPKQEIISRALFIIAEVGRGMYEDALDSYKRAVDKIPTILKLLTNDFWPKDIKAAWDNQINQLAVKTRQSISDCRYSSFMVERILVVWEKPEEELEVDFDEWQLNEHKEREAKSRQHEMEQAKRLYTPKGIPTVLKAIEHTKELLEMVDNAVASVMLLSLNVQRQEHLMCQFISERYQQAGGTDLDVERGKTVQKRLTRLLYKRTDNLE